MGVWCEYDQLLTGIDVGVTPEGRSEADVEGHHDEYLLLVGVGRRWISTREVSKAQFFA